MRATSWERDSLYSSNHETGLTEADADRRRAVFGPNTPPKPKRRGPFLVYLAQFKSPLIYVLVAAAAVSLAFGELTAALFIFAVLQINAVIGRFGLQRSGNREAGLALAEL